MKNTDKDIVAVYLFQRLENESKEAKTQLTGAIIEDQLSILQYLHIIECYAHVKNIY